MMDVGKRYIVTKSSDDETFLVGDHITLTADGSIISQEGEGWLEKDEVAEATKGMEVELDQDWIAQKRSRLLEELAALN